MQGPLADILIVVYPLQSRLCQPIDFLDSPYPLGTWSSHSYYLHRVTILSVTCHYEREQPSPCSALNLGNPRYPGYISP